MQSDGEWNNAVVDNRTKAEWVIQTKERILVASNKEGRMRGCDYRMPYVQAEVGMIVGYIRDTIAEVGCVTKKDSTGIWVVRGDRDRTRRRADGMGVVFSGSNANREEIGDQWRVLDLESDEAMQRATKWVADCRDSDLEVRIVSSSEHCECKTVVR